MKYLFTSIYSVFTNNRAKKENDSSEPKQEIFHFELIEYLFRKSSQSNNVQTIDNKTADDIDFDALFKYLDRTSSVVGQQYYFKTLLTINPSKDFSTQEKWIKRFNENKVFMNKISSILSILNTKETYYICNLFIDEYIKRPTWFKYIKYLMPCPLVFLVLFFYWKPAIFFLIGFVCINLGIHYYNKNTLYVFKDSIPQLLKLLYCIREINKLDLPTSCSKTVLTAQRNLENIKRSLSLFDFENKIQSDIYQLLFLVIEYIKIFFLYEPIAVFNALHKLETQKMNIETLFSYIGNIDSYLSITRIRQELSYFCIPTIIQQNDRLSFKDAYHPLILNCISNSLTVDNKSVLLTGSNMAGKTTFIRVIAINCLLAQTINTAFARTFKMQPMFIFSAIRISDDILNNRSYYFQEVLTIKHMIEESEKPQQNLFLLDEILKGTNTLERISAAKSVLSYLAKMNRNLIFVSTHDVELPELLEDKYALFHFSETIKNDQIYFDFKLKPGYLKTRNAIRILEINNYPKEVIEDARNTTTLLHAVNKQL